MTITIRQKLRGGGDCFSAVWFLRFLLFITAILYDDFSNYYTMNFPQLVKTKEKNYNIYGLIIFVVNIQSKPLLTIKQTHVQYMNI